MEITVCILIKAAITDKAMRFPVVVAQTSANALCSYGLWCGMLSHNFDSTRDMIIGLMLVNCCFVLGGN